MDKDVIRLFQEGFGKNPIAIDGGYKITSEYIDSFAFSFLEEIMKFGTFEIMIKRSGSKITIAIINK